jgi:uncharacterized membrane protein
MEIYIIFGIIAMVLYGVTASIYKVASPHIDAVSLTLLVSVFMTGSVFVYWLFIQEKMITMRGFELSVVAGVIAAIAFVSFVTAISLGKVSVATTMRGLSFTVTVAIAILFLSEQLTALKFFGILLGVIALVLLSV